MPCLYVQYVIFLFSNVTTKIKNAEYDFIPVSVKNIELKKIPFMQLPVKIYTGISRRRLAILTCKLTSVLCKLINSGLEKEDFCLKNTL